MHFTDSYTKYLRIRHNRAVSFSNQQTGLAGIVRLVDRLIPNRRDTIRTITVDKASQVLPAMLLTVTEHFTPKSDLEQRARILQNALQKCSGKFYIIGLLINLEKVRDDELSALRGNNPNHILLELGPVTLKDSYVDGDVLVVPSTRGSRGTEFDQNTATTFPEHRVPLMSLDMLTAGDERIVF